VNRAVNKRKGFQEGGTRKTLYLLKSRKEKRRGAEPRKDQMEKRKRREEQLGECAINKGWGKFGWEPRLVAKKSLYGRETTEGDWTSEGKI